MKSWKDDAYKQLDSISKLKNNWNDNSANSFKKALIIQAEKIINDLPIEYEIQIFPTARDSIQFEYEKDNIYLELELFEINSSVYFSNYKETILDLDYINTDFALKIFIDTIKKEEKKYV